ncbi:MAG: hypothetical protein D4S01_05100 [Dehalococcoidia bacterium]|nr:MAG: hypothetical protein D4S01_05100 [Dehalococcoidia bacterium]
MSAPKRTTKSAVAQAGNNILRMWKEVIDEAKVRADPGKECWYRHDIRQGYQDSMNALKHARLITDYNVETCEVTLP